MIKGMHGMMMSTDAEATRAFFRDVLAFPATDVGEGWLIFDMPEADLGIHPGDAAGYHVSFYCDDIAETRRDLERASSSSSQSPTRASASLPTSRRRAASMSSCISLTTRNSLGSK